jgi:hypothetical protein
MMKRLLKTTSALAGSVALALMTTPKDAASITYKFYKGTIHVNNPTDAAIGEAQLSVDVTDAGGGQILFKFLNSGPRASSIAQIYFDDFDSDPLLKNIAKINNGRGVSFSMGATPGHLPGGDEATPAFEKPPDFSVGAKSPPSKKGVGPGEYVGILFNLKTGKAFSDAIAALDNGNLRTGMHVIAFASGGSESFVNDPPIALPVPGTLVLFGTGSVVAAITALRRRWRSTSSSKKL